MRTQFGRLAISVHGFLLSLGGLGQNLSICRGHICHFGFLASHPLPAFTAPGQQMHFLAEFLDPLLRTPLFIDSCGSAISGTETLLHH